MAYFQGRAVKLRGGIPMDGHKLPWCSPQPPGSMNLIAVKVGCCLRAIRRAFQRRVGKTKRHHGDVSKNRVKTPKVDGENKGKPYFLMDDSGCFPPIFGNTHGWSMSISKKC